MKYLFFLLFISLASPQGYYFSKVQTGAGGKGAAFDSCGTAGMTYDNNTFAWNWSAQVGVNYRPTSVNRTVGAVAININAIQGSLAGVNFECVIKTVPADSMLDGTVMGTSTARTLANGWCKFDFTSGITLTASTQYYIAVRRVDKSYHGDNYAFVSYGTSEWVTGSTGVYCNAHLWYGSNDDIYDTYDNPYTFRLYIWE